jgi:tetratricopeptide (TPR) repeat protein
MRRFITTSILLTMVFSFAAFECSSSDIMSAKMYKDQGHMDKAKKSLINEVTKNPQSSEGYYLLGEIFAGELNVDSMLLCFDKSLAIDSTYKKEIGIYTYNSWIKCFNNGATFWDKSVKTTYADSSKIFVDKAVNSYEDAIKCEPDSSITYENLSFVLMKSERYNDAIEPIKKLIEIKNDADSYSLLGDIYFTKGNLITDDSLAKADCYAKGLDVLETAVDKFPENADLLSTLTNAYIATNRFDEARSKLEKGIQLQPDNKYFRYSYGLLLIDANHPEEAIKQFDKALEIDPEFGKAIYYTGIATFNIAVNIRKHAEEVFTSGSDQTKYDAEIKKSDEKFKEALDILLGYTKMDLDNSENAWVPIWKIYTQLNMKKEADDAYKKAYPNE